MDRVLEEILSSKTRSTNKGVTAKQAKNMSMADLEISVLCAPKDGEALRTHQHCWRGGWIWSVWCSQHFTVAYRGGAGLIRTRGRTRMMARMGIGMGFGRSLSLSGKRLVRRNRFSIFKRVLGAHACGKIWSLHKGRNQSNVPIWTIVL